MKTKEKILVTALQLFNKNGIDNVTVRSIAFEMGISHGNLCYHFPNTDDIIYKLYLNLVDELSSIIEKMDSSNSILQQLYDLSGLTFKTMYQYKFILIDFVSILRKIDPIRKYHKNLIKNRKHQFTHIINILINKKLIIEEKIPNTYAQVVERFMIFGDSWIAHAEVFYDGKEKEKSIYYSNLILNSLIPFLTKKGLSEFESINRDSIA